MQNSYRDRARDIGYHHQKTVAEDISDIKPMVLSMNSESYQANGHTTDSFDLGREGSSAVGMTKKSLPANGKKTKGRVKIKMEFIDNKLRRYTTFSKRKTGIMKKAYELSTLTGTQVMLLVASETGHVYTFATRKLQPMITSEAGKALIQTCLNSPDPPPGPGASGLDQRMSATGFEETDLTYSVADDCEKMSDSPGNTMFSPDISPTSMGSGTTLLAPSTIVSFASGLPTCTTSPRLTTSKPVSLTSPSTSTSSPSSSSGLSTILTASTTGGSKQQAVSSSSDSSSSHNSLSVVQSSPQNLSVVSGNVVIPQTILQTSNNSALLYHTGQGLVYATPTNLPEGVVLNLGQEQGGTQQQFITIPVSLSLTPAQQQQLIQGTASSQSSTFSNTTSSRKDKSRK